MFTLLKIRYRYALLIFSFSIIVFFLVGCKPPIEKTTASTNNDFPAFTVNRNKYFFLLLKLKTILSLNKLPNFHWQIN